LTFDAPADPLVRCGVDIEEPGRFRRFLEADGAAGDGASLIWHPGEIGAALKSADPCRWLCRCFCCKEAVFKALGQAYNYNELECLPHDNGPDWRLWGGLAAGELPVLLDWDHQIGLVDTPLESRATIIFFKRAFLVYSK
jgi:phosphopantetheinyl transferase (holo-ACP synthase)